VPIGLFLVDFESSSSDCGNSDQRFEFCGAAGIFCSENSKKNLFLLEMKQKGLKTHQLHCHHYCA